MKKFILVLFLLTTIACGGSSGSDAPLLSIDSPSGATMRAGESMILSVSTNGFTLREPQAVSPNPGELHVGSLARLAHTAESEMAMTEEQSEEELHLHDDGSLHDHASDEIVGTADESTSTSSEDHGHTDSEADTEHSHDTSETNPFATHGHMHIYLDGGMGSEPHITSWAQQTPISLPADIAPGMHSLRLELRDDSHTPVGQEHDQYYFFEVVE